MDSSCTQDSATLEDIGMDFQKQTDRSYRNISGRLIISAIQSQKSYQSVHLPSQTVVKMKFLPLKFKILPFFFYGDITLHNRSAKIDRQQARQKQVQGGIYDMQHWLLINTLQIYGV